VSAGRASLWVPFAAVLAAGLLVTGPALAWPMAFDDLHLMRRFTRAQLLAAFHGQWDPERLMTRGLRPLTMLFNHARTALFGDEVRAHRVFVLILQAAYWALLAPVARRLGMAAATVAVAGVLWACAVPSVFHSIWITDGNHVVQGLSFVLATLTLLQALETAHPAVSAGLQLASLGALLAGLLTREDTLAAVPALLVLGYVRAAAQNRRRLFWVHALAVVLLCGAVLAYRARVVARVKPPRLDLPGMLQHVLWTSNPLGTSWFDGLSALLVVGWWVALAVVGLAFLARVPGRRWTGVSIWLLCAFLACSPGLTPAPSSVWPWPGPWTACGTARAGRGWWRPLPSPGVRWAAPT
jgi:hypothetical protein